MSTLGDVQYVGEYHDAWGGGGEGEYHEYIEGCSVHRSFQYKSKAFINSPPHMNHIPSI